jgi:hypothetical protein
MMSSTSSTSGASAGATAGAPWQFFLTASFVAAAVAVWISPPSSPIALLFLSLAVAAAGGCAAALHGVLRAVAGRSPAETGVSGSVREDLEREKLLALRALKDLEFDRAMGKVSAADAAPLEARLRARAIAIMRELEGRESLRARIEEDLAKRSALGARPSAPQGGAEPALADTPSAEGRKPIFCACGAANDSDANFCKGCGTRL